MWMDYLTNTGTKVWSDGYGNWRVEFPTTGLDITDHEYAVTLIRAELLQRGDIAADYIPPVRFVSAYRERVEFTESDPTTQTIPVTVG